jgi:hypothetical protein
MDYQASTSCGKEVERKKISQRYFSRIGVAFAVLLSSSLFCAADDPAPNPLIENITISATVLQIPGVHPETPPLPPNAPSGPVNMSDTVDVAVFKGLAYPRSTISLLKNGIILAEIPANPNGSFEIHVRNLNPGTYSFGIRAEDSSGLQSKLLVFTIFVSSSVATIVEGIFIPPTITSDKTEVRKGDPITFSGRSAPDAEVRLSLTQNSEIIKKAKAGADGSWIYMIDSSELDLGDNFGKARSLTTNDTSPYSDLLLFRVGDTNRLRPKNSNLAGYRKRCDLNDDGRVNLLDFSIMAFWYKRLTFPPKVDLNSDKNVNLTDLSILAYCWTG